MHFKEKENELKQNETGIKQVKTRKEAKLV
jgi:hypothetical protein